MTIHDDWKEFKDILDNLNLMERGKANMHVREILIFILDNAVFNYEDYKDKK